MLFVKMFSHPISKFTHRCRYCKYIMCGGANCIFLNHLVISHIRLTLYGPTACAPSYMYRWSLQSNCRKSNLNMNLCKIECVWNVITQSRFLSFLDHKTAPSIFLYSCCRKWFLQRDCIESERREKKAYLMMCLRSNSIRDPHQIGELCTQHQ